MTTWPGQSSTSNQADDAVPWWQIISSFNLIAMAVAIAVVISIHIYIYIHMCVCVCSNYKRLLIIPEHIASSQTHLAIPSPLNYRSNTFHRCAYLGGMENVRGKGWSSRCKCIYVYIHYTYVHIYIYIYICVCVYVRVMCIYIYIY